MQLSQLFTQATGLAAGEQIALTASGSNRRYHRIWSEDKSVSLIGVEGTSRDENHAFLTMSAHFASQGLNVPRVLAVSDDEMQYVQQDLGNTLLFDYIAEGRKTGVFCESEKVMLRKTIRALAQFQVKAAEDFDFNVCYPQPEFNLRSIRWDLNYFKYCFLKATGVEFQEDKLENEFERLAYILLEQKQMNAFMYRDFQSRNVMIYVGEPYFIDFQGGRRGPIYYDLASFLWQAKANFPQALRERLLNEYRDELEKVYPNSEFRFQDSDLKAFVLFRTLQVLGAYGFRGLIEHKQHFIESIPFAIKNLSELFTLNPELRSAYPYIFALSNLLRERAASETLTRGQGDSTLTIDILSFSFKKGLPLDPSGNGGGYIFDCRSTHNPGKYEQYKQLTGLDKPVIEFLESDGEILTFLDSVYRLVDHHVERFLERGFTHLQVAFGCTGGQHRSVYSAEATARHLHAKYPETNIQVTHRELSAR